MYKITKIRLLIILVFLLSLVDIFGKEQSSLKRPNVLFIMTDQQRYDAIALAGKYTFLKTPNLDRLAKTGAYFSRAYTPCAVCGPARTSILTGLMVEKTRVYTNELTTCDPEKNNFTKQKTFDQILSDNGYYSEYHGKWHAPILWTKCYEGFEYVNPNPKNPYKYTTNHFIKYRKMIADEMENYKEQSGELFD